MAHGLIIRRRQIGTEDIQLISGLLLQEGARGRTYISRRLCQLWDGCQANGCFREIAGRDRLRQLEARGFIQLPARLSPARRPGYQNTVRYPELWEQLQPKGYLRGWCDRIELTRVQSPAQRQQFNGLIGAFHYLGYQQHTGAQLKYLATYKQRPIGCLIVSVKPGAVYPAGREQVSWRDET